MSSNILWLIRDDPKLCASFVILFKSNSYLSYLRNSTTPDLWHDLFNTIKIMLLDGNLSVLSGRISSIIAAIFKAWEEQLNIDPNVVLDPDTIKRFKKLEILTFGQISSSQEAKSHKALYKLSFSDNVHLSNQYLSSDILSLFDDFEKVLRKFAWIENYASLFIKRNATKLAQKHHDQFMTIRCECFQEIYHALSHLALDSHSCLYDKVKCSISHLNRASLDFAKVCVSIKGTINSATKHDSKNARFREMQNIGNTDKKQVLSEYIDCFCRN